MVISKEDAAQALSDINSSDKRAQSMQRYRHAAPYLILWGFVWLVANTICGINSDMGGIAWTGLSWAGAATSFWIGYRSKYRNSHLLAVSSAEVHGKRGFRVFLTVLTIIGYFVALSFILPRMDPKQVNAFISLFWATYYIAIGIWIGMRIAIVGVLISLSVLLAYFVMPQYYFLWMGLVTGSLLILGGVWLRKV